MSLIIKKRAIFPIVIFLLAASSILALATMNPYGFPPQTVALGLLAITLMFSPFFYWAIFTDRSKIPYLGLHGVFMAATYGVGGLIYPIGYTGAFAKWMSTSDFFAPLLYSTISFAIIAIFYFLSQQRLAFPLPSSIKSLSRKFDPAFVIIVLLPVCLVLFQVTAKQDVLTSLMQPVIALRVFVIIWGACLLFSGQLKPWHAIFYWVLICLDVVFNSRLFSGFLADIILYAFYFFIPQMIFRRRIPWFAIALAVTAIFILNPVKSEFRFFFADFRADGGFSINRIETAGELVGARLQNMEFGGLKEDFDEFYDRVLLITTYAKVVSDVPYHHDYLMGETYWPFFVKFIPRALWPGKPTLESSQWAQDYGYANVASLAAYRLPLHVEMFLNFGLFGVILVSAIVGTMLGAIKATFGRYRDNPAVFSLGIMMALPFFWAGERFSAMFGGTVIQFISVYLFARVVGTMLPRSSRGGETRTVI